MAKGKQKAGRAVASHHLTLWSVVAFCCGIVIGGAIMSYTTADVGLPEIVIQQPPVLESPEAAPEQAAVAVVVPVNESVEPSASQNPSGEQQESPQGQSGQEPDNAVHVAVIDVDEAEMRCGIQAGGEFKWIGKGDLEKVGGVYIYVADVVAVHSAGKDVDACELVIGGYGRASATQR